MSNITPLRCKSIGKTGRRSKTFGRLINEIYNNIVIIIIYNILLYIEY